MQIAMTMYLGESGSSLTYEAILKAFDRSLHLYGYRNAGTIAPAEPGAAGHILDADGTAVGGWKVSQ
jgi:hypothetical protein